MNRREASRRASQPRLQGGKKDATPFAAKGMTASQSSGRAGGQLKEPEKEKGRGEVRPWQSLCSPR